MGLFKKKTEAGILPEEVNQYYLSQRRERRSVMLVLSLLALVVTTALGLALFFGGKYLVGKMRDDKNTPSNVVKTNNDNTVTDGLNNFGDKNTSSLVIENTPVQSSNSSQTSTPSTTNSSAPVTQTPALGDDTSPQPAILPATGDEGH